MALQQNNYFLCHSFTVLRFFYIGEIVHEKNTIKNHLSRQKLNPMYCLSRLSKPQCNETKLLFTFRFSISKKTDYSEIKYIISASWITTFHFLWNILNWSSIFFNDFEVTLLIIFIQHPITQYVLNTDLELPISLFLNIIKPPHSLMVKFKRMRNGNLQLGVVTMGLPVQMNPNAGHCKSMSWLGFVNVRYRNILKKEHMNVTYHMG